MTAQDDQANTPNKCGHTGPDWNGEGDCIKCARDKVLGATQDDVDIHASNPLRRVWMVNAFIYPLPYFFTVSVERIAPAATEKMACNVFARGFRPLQYASCHLSVTVNATALNLLFERMVLVVSRGGGVHTSIRTCLR